MILAVRPRRWAMRRYRSPLRQHDRRPMAPRPSMDNRLVPVDHYENFPVASLLCPPRLRPAVEAIYAFARTADDIADEGDAAADERLESLALYGNDLAAVASGRPPSQRWASVFVPLAT